MQMEWYAVCWLSHRSDIRINMHMNFVVWQLAEAGEYLWIRQLEIARVTRWWTKIAEWWLTFQFIFLQDETVKSFSEHLIGCSGCLEQNEAIQYGC